MATEFGKLLRKIRVEYDMILKEMASVLGVSSAYLSSVENGKRNVPVEWFDTLEEKYNLNREKMEELAFVSNKTATINIEHTTTEANETLYSFARKLKSLDTNKLEKINRILKEDDEM